MLLSCATIAKMSLSNTTTIKVNWDSELRKATLKGKVNEIHLAIEKGANIHRSLKGKWTYLHLAARNKHAAALKTLIECGANINAKKDDGATSLHVACSAGYLSITKVLVDNNIDVSHLAPSTYIIKIHIDNIVFSNRLVIK